MTAAYMIDDGTDETTLRVLWDQTMAGWLESRYPAPAADGAWMYVPTAEDSRWYAALCEAGIQFRRTQI